MRRDRGLFADADDGALKLAEESLQAAHFLRDAAVELTLLGAYELSVHQVEVTAKVQLEQRQLFAREFQTDGA